MGVAKYSHVHLQAGVPAVSTYRMKSDCETDMQAEDCEFLVWVAVLRLHALRQTKHLHMTSMFKGGSAHAVTVEDVVKGILEVPLVGYIPGT